MSDIFNKIDKSNPTPIYYQIYLSVKAAIEEEKYKIGDTLPAEPVLQEIFDVSRVTIRKAMERLEKEKYILRKSGRGTLVLNYKEGFIGLDTNNFSYEPSLKGYETTSIILKFDIICPSTKIANLLKIDKGDRVYLLERFRLIEGQIIALSKSYIPVNIPIELRKEDFSEKTSLFEFLNSKGFKIGNTYETLEVKVPTKEIKKLLNMKKNIAVFYRERITYDIENNPFEFAAIYYNGDYYKYHLEHRNQ